MFANGVSSPSSHTTGADPRLPWSCQVQPGVITKSPGRIVTALAVDRGVGALAFDDEAQRVRRVPVRRRDLAGQDRLQAGEQRRGDEGRPRQRRVLEHEHAPLGLARGDQLGAAHQQRPHVGPAPDRRHSGRPGLEANHPLPERRQVDRGDLARELRPSRSHDGGRRRRWTPQSSCSFASRMSLPHFARSARMNASNSSGLLPTGSPPKRSIRSFTSGE